MQCSSSSRLGPVAAALALALSGCAVGLDFDQLSNECSSPQFDVPTSAAYCDGVLVAGTTYRPPDFDFEGAETGFLAVAAEGEWLATAALTYSLDNEGCYLVVPGLNLAEVGEDGTITSFASLSGAGVGVVHRLDDGTATCSGTARYVWPTELAILDTDPYVHVVAAFGDGGIWDVWFDPADADQNPTTRFASIRHLAGDPRGPTSRECVAGACMTRQSQFCTASNECAPGTFCSPDSISCQPLMPCLASGSCGASLVCAGRRNTCTLPCLSDAECSHPQTCSFDGLCGGQGCGEDSSCVVQGFECLNGSCLATCTGEDPCDDDLFCFGIAEDLGVCATGGRIGSCTVDTDCALETAYGLAEVPGNALTSNFTSLLVATEDYLRTASYITGRLEPYLFPPSGELALQDAANTDVIYLADVGVLYLAIDTGVILRIDWSDLTLGSLGADFEDYARLYPFELEPGARLVGLRRVGGYLVTIEGPLARVGEPAPFYSRALRINADPDEDLVPAFEGVLDLGLTSQASIGTDPVAPDLWFYGLSRARGGELVIYDMRDPSAPVRAGALPVGDTGAGEPEYVNVTSAGIFAASTAGVTPYTIVVGGAAP